MDEVVFIEADCKTWENFSQGLHLLESFIQKVSVNFFSFLCAKEFEGANSEHVGKSFVNLTVM